jgi:hypothetical protein
VSSLSGLDAGVEGIAVEAMPMLIDSVPPQTARRREQARKR